MRRVLPVLLAGLAALLLSSPLGAQEPPRPSNCNLVEQADVRRDLVGGVPMIYITGPFLVRCQGGAELRADYGELNQLIGELRLTGNVWFQDPDRTLTAQQANYTSGIGRLYATGDVVFTNRAEGSVLRGPELEYYRALPGTQGRELAQVTATQRPHLTLRPREQAEDGEPLEIDADRVVIYGQDRLSATGNVVIERTDLLATGGEAQYDGAAETLDLRRDARIRSGDYDLAGEVVHAVLKQGGIEQVRARTGARLSGEDLDVRAPDLQLFFAEGLLARAVGIGERPGPDADEPAGEEPDTAIARPDSLRRAIAQSATFRLEADSLDALLPGQQLERVIAVGDARGESIDTTAAATAETPETPRAIAAAPGEVPADTAAADSAASRAIVNDWIRGDTIVGFFGRVASADTVDAALADSVAVPADTALVLQRLVATGSAQSLYRMRQGRGGQPGINFLAGEMIELDLVGGELDVAQVRGLSTGVYLSQVQPARPAAGAAPADTVPPEPGTPGTPNTGQPGSETPRPAPARGEAEVPQALATNRSDGGSRR